MNKEKFEEMLFCFMVLIMNECKKKMKTQTLRLWYFKKKETEGIAHYIKNLTVKTYLMNWVILITVIMFSQISTQQIINSIFK